MHPVVEHVPIGAHALVGHHGCADDGIGVAASEKPRVVEQSTVANHGCFLVVIAGLAAGPGSIPAA